MPTSGTKTTRCTIFAHFDKHNLVDDYVFFYLKKIRTISSAIIFVSTSNLATNEIDRLKALCNVVITRENKGYDFMSWRVGIDTIPDLTFYDELIICNDSVYGPFFSFERIFDTMHQKKCHFWGLTENHAIAYHLQSYFLVFRKEVLTSSQFREFWALVDQNSGKRQAIEKYEVGLTQTLLKANFKPGVYIHYKPTLWMYIKRTYGSLRIRNSIKKSIITNLVLLFQLGQTLLKHLFKHHRLVRRKYLNLTHFAWKELILLKNMPFLKVELLRDNPMHMDINDYESVIRKCSNYNLNLIHNHLKK